MGVATFQLLRKRWAEADRLALEARRTELEAMTKAELVRLGEKRRLRLSSSLRKADLVDRLLEEEGF